MTLAEALEFLKAAGVTGALIFFIVGGFKRWWVWGYQLTDMEKERDWWKNDDLQQRQYAHNALLIGEKLARAIELEHAEKAQRDEP